MLEIMWTNTKVTFQVTTILHYEGCGGGSVWLHRVVLFGKPGKANLSCNALMMERCTEAHTAADLSLLNSVHTYIGMCVAFS